jgi:hypothetical protein
MSAQAPAAALRLDDCWQAVEAEKPLRTDWLLVGILAAVFFTPTFRLPGEIPVRVDDFLVFSAGALLVLKFFFSFRVPRPDAVSVYLTVFMGTILLSSLIAPIQLGVPMTAKDYLDLLRPLKFLLVYWLVREQDCRVVLRTFLITVSVSIGILLAVAVLEMTMARLSIGGPVMSLLLQFCDQQTMQEPVSIMAQRPFATFNTPTHLGYVAALGFFLSQALSSAIGRRILALLSFFALLISVTRTLLFSLPILLIIQALTKKGSAMEKLKRVTYSAILVIFVITMAAVLLPIISPVAAGYTQSMIASIFTGNTENEDSITTRLGNLVLVDYTWTNAPFFGVATRSFLPWFVDSELILTFHRFGIVGMGLLFAIYPVGYKLAKRAGRFTAEFSRFAVMALVVTFLYGITQGALINTRVGVIPFVVLGILAAWSRQGNENRVVDGAHGLSPHA